MNIRYAKENEIEEIKDIWNYCFNDGESFVNYYFTEKYKNTNTVVVEEEGEILSSLQLNQYKLKLNNKIYSSSYVVGVSTFPEVRGRGYMKNIMKYTLKELYNRKQLISILMPIDYRLYRKYGYEHCYDQLEYNINIEELSTFKSNGKIYKINKSNIGDLIDINKSFVKKLNGYVKRDENYYDTLIEEVKSENGHIYIHENDGYEGYIIYFINGDNMFVRELYYKNIKSLESMLKFIYNHNTQCKSVIITTPVNDKIRFILKNLKTCEIKLKPFMMGRVINFKKYLQTLDIDTKYEGSINISIEDEFIEENNKIFNIKLKDNKLYIEETDEACDIHFNINTISQLIFSYIDIYDAIELNDIEPNKETIKLLSKIFKKNNNYINEYV